MTLSASTRAMVGRNISPKIAGTSRMASIQSSAAPSKDTRSVGILGRTSCDGACGSVIRPPWLRAYAPGAVSQGSCVAALRQLGYTHPASRAVFPVEIHAWTCRDDLVVPPWVGVGARDS